MAILWTNNASTTVAGNITATDTTVALAAGSGAKFPAPTGVDYFVATFYDQATKTQTEIVHVTHVTGDVATIVRAQEGTTAKAWSASDIFFNGVTAGTLNSFTQTGGGPINTSVNYVGTDTSTVANTVIANTVPPLTAGVGNYVIGMQFNILIGPNIGPSGRNTGPVTLQLNGTAGVAAVRTDGSALVAGNLISSQEMIFVYNGVNFTSMVLPIPQAPPQTTFYVRPNGNDANTGFADLDAQAFKTVSGAMNAIKSRYISQNQITLRVADGLYTDGIGDTVNYIASWNIVGNTANPGNVVINATSPTSGGSYPPTARIGRSCVSGGSANITVNGLTFQSYYENAVSTSGGVLYVYNCHFTAPTSAKAQPIAANSSGKTIVYGNCQYDPGANPIPALIASYDNGFVQIGYKDDITTISVVFNLATNSAFLTATIQVMATGTVAISDSVVAFTTTGTVPVCPQYDVSSAGGIVFTNGNKNIFPGTKPGVVTAPGWTVP